MAQAVLARPHESATDSYRVPALAFGLVAVLAIVADIAIGTGAWFFAIVGLGTLALVMVRPEFGIGVFLSTFLITYPSALQGGGFLTINNMLGVLFLFLLTQQLYNTGDWWFLRRPEVRLLVFIALCYYLSATLNGPEQRLMDLIGAAEERNDSVRLFLNRVAFLVFFINFIRTPAQMRFICLLAVGIMAFTTLTGVWGVVTGSGFSGPWKVGGTGGFRAYSLFAGTLGNPNRLAMAAIISFGIIWYIVPIIRNRILQAGLIGLLLTMVLGVCMTASRSGLLTLVVCAAFIVVADGIAFRRVLAVALMAAIAISLVLRLVPDKAVDRLSNLPIIGSQEASVGSGSLERREYNWEVGLEVIKQNFVLGVGPGNWAITRYLTDPARITTPPHSSLILAIAEGGILALASFLALFWITWLNLRAALRLLPHRRTFGEVYWIAQGAQVGLIALGAFSMLADLWQSVILFWLVGLGVVLRRYAEEHYFVAA